MFIVRASIISFRFLFRLMFLFPSISHSLAIALFSIGDSLPFYFAFDKSEFCHSKLDVIKNDGKIFRGAIAENKWTNETNEWTAQRHTHIHSETSHENKRIWTGIGEKKVSGNSSPAFAHRSELMVRDRRPFPFRVYYTRLLSFL